MITDYPQCPKCGHKVYDWGDFESLRNDGDGVLIECGECEHPYSTTLQISASFSNEEPARCRVCGELGARANISRDDVCPRCRAAKAKREYLARFPPKADEPGPGDAL